MLWGHRRKWNESVEGVRKGLVEKVTFDQGPEGWNGVFQEPKRKQVTLNRHKSMRPGEGDTELYSPGFSKAAPKRKKGSLNGKPENTSQWLWEVGRQKGSLEFASRSRKEETSMQKRQSREKEEEDRRAFYCPNKHPSHPQREKSAVGSREAHFSNESRQGYWRMWFLYKRGGSCGCSGRTRGRGAVGQVRASGAVGRVLFLDRDNSNKDVCQINNALSCSFW